MNKRGSEKLEVVYNVIFIVKDEKKITDKEIEDILTKKLLRVILNLENTSGIALNNF